MEILKDPARHTELMPYVKGIVGHFKDDPRIHAWDVFNEPDNTNKNSYGQHEPANKSDLALMLIKRCISVGAQSGSVAAADIGSLDRHVARSGQAFADGAFSARAIRHHQLPQLQPAAAASSRRWKTSELNRPILCTEYMARPAGSTFDPNLGYLASQKVSVLQLGLCFREVSDDLPMGFMAEAIFC